MCIIRLRCSIILEGSVSVELLECMFQGSDLKIFHVQVLFGVNK